MASTHKALHQWPLIPLQALLKAVQANLVMPALFFFPLLLALLLAALLGPPLLQWSATLLSLWLCLGLCWLNRTVHQQKKQCIEGMRDRKNADALAFDEGLSTTVTFLAHLFLLGTIILLLRLCAHAWGTSLFSPAPTSLKMWTLYTLDLLCKATLFDIPEIYQLNLVNIKHVGFFGATLVFATRLVILALIVGALMRWRELYKLLERNVSLAQHNPALSRQRLRTTLDLYPHQIKRLCRWAHHPKWHDKRESRCANLQTIGQSFHPLVYPTLCDALKRTEAYTIQEAALIGLARYGRGPLDIVQQLLHNPTEPQPTTEPQNPAKPQNPTDTEAILSLHTQACNTLAAWNTQESLEALNDTALHHPNPDVRLAAIDAFKHAPSALAKTMLANIMFSGKRNKQERFGAKDALAHTGPLSHDLRAQIQHELAYSPYADNRRFAGMVLEASEDKQSFELLATRLHEEQDPHALVYIIQGLAKIAYDVYDKPAQNQFDTLQQMYTLYTQSTESKIYPRLRTLILDGPNIVTRIAAIQALADFVGIWSVDTQDPTNAPSAKALLAFVDTLIDDPDPQIADVAMDTRARFPAELIVRAEEFDEGGYRRDAHTCAGVSFHVDSFRAARPAMFQGNPVPPPAIEDEDEDDYRRDAYTIMLPALDLGATRRTNSTRPPASRDPHKTLSKHHTKTPHHDGHWEHLPQWMHARYRFKKTVSRGNLATVYRVYDRIQQLDKALKLANSDEMKLRQVVLREIEALTACASPGLLPILDAYPNLDRPAFTVPWVEQQTLFQAMVQRSKQQQPWSRQEVQNIMAPLSDILQAMHNRGWCHGDIKPENVFYSGQQVILYDMDASRQIDDDQASEPLTLPIGTPYYMAPEQVHRKAIDRRVDIYALGILTYELLAGALPLGMAPPPLSDVRDDLPPQVDAVVKKATAFEAQQRFQSPHDFKHALQHALSS